LSWPENINKRYQNKICSKCGKTLRPDVIRSGTWVKKYRNRDISGYWISQLMIPWITAEKIIDDSKGDLEIFHNFTLGLPYVSKDTQLSRESIVKCISPGFNPKTNVAIGVDNGIEKTYVLGNHVGIFEIGKTRDWEVIEKMRNKHQATMVIDALPYPNIPTKLAEKYPGKVYIHYYQQDRRQSDIVKWDTRVVRSDRTKIIDSVVADVNASDVVFNLTQSQLEQYIHDWEQMYRVIEETPQGISKPKWKTIQGRDDHFCHAHIYWKLAMMKTLAQGTIIKTAPVTKGGKHPYVTQDGSVKALDLQDVVKRAKRRKFK